MATKTKKPKCRICGKIIHKGGLYRNKRHFHKACFDKLGKSVKRIKEWD